MRNARASPHVAVAKRGETASSGRIHAIFGADAESGTACRRAVSFRVAQPAHPMPHARPSARPRRPATRRIGALLSVLSLILPLLAGPAMAQGSGPQPKDPAPPAPASAAPAAAPVPGRAVDGPPGPPPEAPKPFGVERVEVAAERDRPQACFAFTRPLPPKPAKPRKGVANVAEFVTVTPAEGTSVAVRGNELCLEGLAHARRYTVTLAAGLPAATGETLVAPVTREVGVPDRRPSLAFRGQGYILPRVGPDGLPLRAVNVDRARLQVLRIKDRALVERIYWGRISQTLTDFDVGTLLDAQGEVVWRGEMALGGEPNRGVSRPFPLDAVLGDLTPGVYIAVAENAALPMVAWDQRATQWFVVSDIGLTSFRAANGLFVFARSLKSAQPLDAVELRLVSRDNTELGRAVTGPDGLARFAPEMLTGADGRTPQALFAAGPDGDFSLLDFGTPAVELAGRGGPGRTMPGALDAWLWTARGVYRPGDPVEITALLRDAEARAVTGQALMLRLVRPDGLEADRQLLSMDKDGAYAARFDLPATAMAGRWQIVAHGNGPGGEAAAVGRVEFTVGDVLPPRLDVTLTADRPRVAADGKLTLSVDARYLSGGDAARLPGELSLTIRPVRRMDGADGFRFGLAQEETEPQRRSLPGFTTNTQGDVRVPLELGPLPQSSRPLEAVIRATLYDVGGRPVERELVLPVDHQPYAIGLRPQFAGEAVPEGATVAFDVAARSADGRTVAKAGLSWELFEEEQEYAWFEADGRWDYKASVKDRRLTGGTIDVPADAPALLEEQVKAGRYRLEVFDPATGIASSVRFSAGWWVSAKPGDTPDAVEVVVMKPVHERGGTATVFVRPPYDATVLVTLADRTVRHTTTRTIGPAGAFLELPVDADLTAGASVLATAYAPADPKLRMPPRRAVGAAWIAIDPTPRQLFVTAEPPAEARPRGPVTIPISVAGAAAGETVHVSLSAVSQPVQALTGRPDPAGWYFGRRRLSVELRDVYGRLLDPAAPVGADPVAAQGGTATPPAAPGTDVVALTTAIVTLGPDGTGAVTLDLPDFQGRLSLNAVAWSAEKVGRGEGELMVRDPVAVDVGLPRFLAPEDRAQIAITVDNAAGARGAYGLEIAAEGPLAIEGGATAEFKALARGRRVTVGRTLVATGAGDAVLRLTLSGPDGYRVTRTFPIPVRGASPVRSLRTLATLEPGRSMPLAVEGVGALRPESATAAVSLGARPPFDMPGLLLTLDTRAYGSAEQLAGRLLPLLYVNELARELGLPADAALKERVRGLIEPLSQRQRADGAYALWHAEGPADPWLTAFVLDVLTRAREAGYAVPEAGYRRGLEWLQRSIANAWVDRADLPARAYALYTAVRARAVDAAPVLFFYETHFEKLNSRLARAQIAAAFALLQDGARAAAAFARVDAAPAAADIDRDFGTELRDRAAALSLKAVSGVAWDRLAEEVNAIAAMLPEATRVSVQERAWLLLAGHEMTARVGPMAVSIDGQALTPDRTVTRRLDLGREAPVVANIGPVPVAVMLSAVGLAAEPPGPEAQGFDFRRQVLDGRGKPVDLAKVRAGDLLVIVLEGEATAEIEGPVLVVDPLPAGLVIENVRLAGSAQLGDLSWLGPLSDAARVDFRDDRFVAALEPAAETRSFRLVYLARAVTPGTYAVAPARVEDLVNPRTFARTGAGTLTILPRRAG